MAQAGARGAKLWLGAGSGGDGCATRYQKAKLERAIRGDFPEEGMPEMSSSPKDEGGWGSQHKRKATHTQEETRRGPRLGQGLCGRGLEGRGYGGAGSDLAGGGQHFWAARSHQRWPDRLPHRTLAARSSLLAATARTRVLWHVRGLQPPCPPIPSPGSGQKPGQDKEGWCRGRKWGRGGGASLASLGQK